MRTLIISCIVLILSLPSSVFCQEMSFSDYDNCLGVKYSNISGYGIYYTRDISENYKVQVMGLAYYLYSLSEGIEHKNFNWDLGLEIQRNLVSTQNFRLFFVVGGYYYFDDDKKKSESVNLSIENHSFNVGMGLSGEFYYKRFVVNLYLGYKYYQDKLKTTDKDKQYPELKSVTKLGAGLGVGFMF